MNKNIVNNCIYLLQNIKSNESFLALSSIESFDIEDYKKGFMVNFITNISTDTHTNLKFFDKIDFAVIEQLEDGSSQTSIISPSYSVHYVGPLKDISKDYYDNKQLIVKSKIDMPLFDDFFNKMRPI